MPRAVVIQNPFARNAIPLLELEAATCVLGHEWECEVQPTTAPDGPLRLALAAAEDGADAVFACGGDGTLNGVINGVVESGRRGVIVGHIPAGTANVWAREAGIPRDPLTALHLLKHGRTVEVDLGVVRVGSLERRFLLMCSMGFDAAIVRRVEAQPGLKRRLAQGAFVVAGARAFAHERPVPVAVNWDEDRSDRSLFIAVAGNSRLYGGISQLTSAARMDDGLLDLVLFEARPGLAGLGDAGSHLAKGMLRGKRPWHDVQQSRFEYQRASRLQLNPGGPLALQVDGEFLVEVAVGTPITLEAERKAVRMLVSTRTNPLFDD